MNWKKVKTALWKIDDLIKGQLLSHKKISEESLLPWKSAILTKVEKKKLKS